MLFVFLPRQYQKWYMSARPMRQLPAFFYALSSGREPVREWLKGLSADDRGIIGKNIKDVEFGPLACRCAVL